MQDNGGRRLEAGYLALPLRVEGGGFCRVAELKDSLEPLIGMFWNAGSRRRLSGMLRPLGVAPPEQFDNPASLARHVALQFNRYFEPTGLHLELGSDLTAAKKTRGGGSADDMTVFRLQTLAGNQRRSVGEVRIAKITQHPDRLA